MMASLLNRALTSLLPPTEALRLSNLPVPALSLITDLLYVKSVRSLYLCGDSALNLRIRNGGISKLQYHLGTADSWKYRGTEFSGRLTPVPVQHPIEGVTHDDIRGQTGSRPGLSVIFNVIQFLPRLRVLSIYRYTGYTPFSVYETLNAAILAVPHLPPTLETLELYFESAWMMLVSFPKDPKDGLRLPVEAAGFGSKFTDLLAKMKWLPLKTLFPGLKHLIVSSRFTQSEANSEGTARQLWKPMQKAFYAELPASTLEVLDCDFLTPFSYADVNKDAFPRLDSLTVSISDSSDWTTLFRSGRDLWSHLPINISKLVLQSLELTDKMMRLLPPMLVELEVSTISRSCDPFSCSETPSPTPLPSDTALTEAAESDLDAKEEAFISTFPVAPFPFPPYLACLTTGSSEFWTRTLARRVPASVLVFRLRKAYVFQMHQFSLIHRDCSSIVIYSIPSTNGKRQGVTLLAAVTLDSFSSFSHLRLEYLRVAASPATFKCRLPFEDTNLRLGFLETLVLPRAALSEDCLLALPRTLRRLDVQVIRSTGTLLHYFDVEMRIRNHLPLETAPTFDRPLPRNPYGRPVPMPPFLTPNYMSRLSRTLVRFKDVPETYKDDPLFSNVIEIVDVPLLERAISIFCNIHFPGLQGFLPPISCISVTWVPSCVKQVNLKSTAIPLDALPSLTRVTFLNHEELQSMTYIPPNVTELDWRDSNGTNFAHLQRLPPSLTRFSGNPMSIYCSPESEKMGTRSPTGNGYFDWRLSTLIETPRNLEMPSSNASTSQPSTLSESEHDLGAGVSSGGISSESSFGEDLPSTPLSSLTGWRIEDSKRPLKRLTFPDDLARITANVMHIEFVDGASVSYSMSNSLVSVRAFPRTLQELILRGTGHLGRQWSPPEKFDESHNPSPAYDPTFSPCTDAPSENIYSGVALHFKPWNYPKPNVPASKAARENSSTALTLNTSGKSRYNDLSGEGIPLYPSGMTQVKFLYGAIAQYPLSVLPSWLVRIHFERHLIRKSLLIDMTDYLPILATLIITNGCLLTEDLPLPETTENGSAIKKEEEIQFTLGASRSVYARWNGNGFAELLPRTLTTLVADCLDLPEWTEEEYAKLPTGLTALYLAPQSKNDSKKILEWIGLHAPAKHPEPTEEAQWLSKEISKQHPPVLRGSEGLDRSSSRENE